MKQIMTTTGPIKPEQLGLTSMHDHVLVNASFFCDLFKGDFPNTSKALFPAPHNLPVDAKNLKFLSHGHRVFSQDNWDLNDTELMSAEVSDFRQLGGRSMLETSAPGIRRNIKGLKKVSQNSGVNIIASTGCYVEESWPQWFLEMDFDQYVDFMKKEISEGIDGTSIKAGHIKTAILNFTPREKEFMKAAVLVSNETGFLITAHTSSMTSLEDRKLLLNNFMDHGITPDKLLICHIQMSFFPIEMETLIRDPESWKLNLDWAREVLDAGANICVDLFGPSYDMEALGKWEVPEMAKMAGLVALINEGYADQIVIGNDLYQKIMTRRYGGHGYCRILNFVLPTLKKLGIKESDIEKISIKNAARLLQY